jgi:predicted small secreted protein
MSARRPVERRTRALIGLRAAHAFLLAGDVDQSAATVLGLGEDVRSISSARVRNQLRQLRADWQPYRSNAQIAAADRLVTSA